MALIVDGVEIPITADVDYESWSKSKKAIDESLARGQKLIDQIDAQKKKRSEERAAAVSAEKAKQDAIAKTTQELNRQREQMERLAQIGMKMGAVGVAMLAPFIAAQKQYMDNASASDRVANRWKSSTDKITEATMRLGRETTAVLNPAYEKFAGIIDQISRTLEQNPGMVEAGLGMGGTLAAGGATVAALATISKELMTVSQMTGNKGLGAVGAGAGKLAEVALYATTVVLAAEAGLAIGNAINKALGQQEQGWRDIYVTFMSIAPAVIKMFADGLDAIGLGGGVSKTLAKSALGQRAEVERQADALFGKPEARAESPASIQTKKDDELFQRWMSETTAAAVDAAEKRAAAEKETQEKIVSAQKSYSDKRANIEKSIQEAAANYAKQSAEALQAHLEAERTATQQYQTESQRAAEDHADRLKQIEAESRDRIEGLVSQRDALGIVREKRAAQKAIDAENEQYNKEKKRRDQDFQQKMREMDRNFAIESQKRRQEYLIMQQARQAELQAAQTVLTAQLHMLQVAQQAAAQAAQITNPYANVMQTQGGGGGGGNSNAATVSSNPYANVMQTQNANSGGGAASNKNYSVSVQGGALSVATVKQIVGDAISSNNNDFLQALA